MNVLKELKNIFFGEKTKRNVSGKVIFRYCGVAADTTCSRLQFTALDMMFVLSFLHERNKDAQVMIEFFQGRDGIFPLFCMGFFNIYGVYVLAHYCCYKVYCTGYLLEVIHFLRKKAYRGVI